MPSSYPVAYRGGSQGDPGFQGTPRSPLRPPGNDNAPRRGPYSAPFDRGNKRTAMPRGLGAAKLAARGLARFIPYVGVGLIAFEAYTALHNLNRSADWSKQVDIGDYHWHVGPACHGNPISRFSIQNRLDCGVAPGYAWPSGWADHPYPDGGVFIGAWFWDNLSKTGLGYPLMQYYGTLHRDVSPAQNPKVFYYAPEIIPGTAYPALDPMVLPIGQPVAVPRPIPYKAIPRARPDTHRAESTKRGPVPRRSPEPVYITWAPPGYPVVPVQDIPWELTLNPVTGDTRLAASGGHKLEPPGKNTKERKAKLLAGSVGIKRGLNIITESVDVLEAIFWALPANRRWGAYTPQEKLKRIYLYYDEIDMSDAILNLLYNEVQDRIVGGLSSKVTKSSKWYYDATGNPIGFQTGPAI